MKVLVTAWTAGPFYPQELPNARRAGERSALCRYCCKSPKWTSDAQTLSVHLKWHFSR